MKTFKVYPASGQIVAEIHADFFRVESTGIVFFCKSNLSVPKDWFALASVLRVQEENSNEAKPFVRDSELDENVKVSCGPK